MVDMIERGKKVTDSAKKHCSKELREIDEDLCTCKGMILLLLDWQKQQIIPQDWIEHLQALRERGLPLMSQVIKKTTYEQEMKTHMQYDKVAMASIPLVIHLFHPFMATKLTGMHDATEMILIIAVSIQIQYKFYRGLRKIYSLVVYWCH